MNYYNGNNSNPNCNCNCKREFCESIRGNSFDVDLNKNDCEIRADVKVGKKNCVRLWGQVKDCDDQPVQDALVKLLKPIYKQGKVEYIGIAHTITDCLGFYQFDVCPSEECAKFHVIVSKASAGNERTIIGEGDCDPCDD